MNAEVTQRLVQAINKASNEIREKGKYGTVSFTTSVNALIVKAIILSSKKIDYKRKKNQLVIKINGVKKLLNLC